MSTTKNHMSIGEVLKTLVEEFPDISISKIRFLETEGLIEPERTPSGYRKFKSADLARLKYILRLQRDHFMPLKVIRKRLEHFDPTAPQEEAPTTPTAPAPVSAVAVAPPMTNADDDELLGSADGGLSLSFEELVSSSGLESDEIEELQEFGLIDAHALDDGGTYYNEDDLMVAKIARDFAKYGMGARHLRMYRNFADKEAGLFEQIIVPMSRSSTSDGRRQLDQSLIELSKLSHRLKRILLRSSINRDLGR